MKMKKVYLLLAFAFICSTGLKAQSYIKINPLTLAFGYIGLDYEQVVSDKNSFTAGAGFYTSGSELTGRYTGFGLNAGYRFYISKEDAPKGLFVSPIAGVSFFSYKYPSSLIGGGFTGTNFSYTTLNIGGIVGYQWLFSDDQFSFELGVGPSFGIRLGGEDTGLSLLGNGFTPAAVLSIGYRLSGGK
jgi:Protein of unknown function (DUF3575)